MIERAAFKLSRHAQEEMERRFISFSLLESVMYNPEEAEARLSPGDPFIRKIFKEGKVLYG